MKKSLFVILMMALGQIGFAQSIGIDEDDLVGKWALESATGDFNYFHYRVSMLRPDSIEVYTETRHTESPESLGVAKYYEGKREIIEYDEETWQEIHTGQYYDYYQDQGITDIFISNYDKLHILLHGSHYILRYRIIAYDGSAITLKTMDGMGTLVYRKQIPTRIAQATVTRGDDESYYKLNGVSMKDKPANEAYIRKGKKFIR